MRAIVDLILRIAVNGVALWLAGLLVVGVHFGRGVDTAATLTTVVLVAVVFGLINAVIKPIVKLLATPLIWLTLGLFSVVVNAAMLAATSWAAGKLGLAFHVDAFWWDAVLGAVVVTLVQMVLHAVLPDPKR